MDGQSKLDRLQEALRMFREDASQWNFIAGRDALLEGAIREAVEESLRPDGTNPLPALIECWGLFPEDTASLIEVYLEDSTEERKSFDCGRLHRNAKGMLATGLAAVVAAQAVRSVGGADEVFEWWRKAIDSIGETAGSGNPKDDWSQLSGHRQADALSRTRALVEWAHRECVEAGWVLPGPFRWTMAWLDSAGWAKGRRVSVKAGGVHAKRGFLADLQLEVLGGREGILVEHPNVRLRPFDKDFLEGLQAAWSGAKRDANKEESAPNVCWSLAVPVEIAPPWQPLSGDSLSGAAVRAFWHVVRDELPDPGVVVFARVRRDVSPLEPEVLLAEVDVETIHLKVIAAAGDPSTDTIVVAGEDNSKKAVETLAKLIREGTLARGRVRVVNLVAEPAGSATRSAPIGK